MKGTISSLLDKAGASWCELMHDDIMWPVEGRYRCKTCLREYKVSWGKEKGEIEQHASPGLSFHPPATQMDAPGLRP